MKLSAFVVFLCALVTALPAAAQNATVTYTITNHGVELGEKAWFGVYRPGEHDSYLLYAYSGKSLEIADGTYDVGVTYQDGNLKVERWFEKQVLRGDVRQTVELDVNVAQLTVRITNGGADPGEKAWWGLYKPGEHDHYLAYEYSGKTLPVLEGTYDIGVEFKDGDAKVQRWLTNQRIAGRDEVRVELSQPLAHMVLTVTNGGKDTGEKSWWAIYKPGEHDSYLAYAYSGKEMTVPEGTYDLALEFKDGEASARKWFLNEKLAGETTKSVELGLPVAALKVAITNNGQDLGQKAWWGLYEPGERSNYYAFAYSGEALTVAQGVYDLGLHYADGAAAVERWVPGFEVKGDSEKAIDLAAGIAELTVHVTRLGKALPDAWCGAYKSKDASAYDAYAYSDKPLRVLEGTYDIGCFSEQEGVTASAWVEKKVLKGSVSLAVPLDLVPVSLTVSSLGAGKGTGAAETAGAQLPVNIALILDASGSMAAKVEEQKTRLDVAKEVLTEIVEGLPAAGVNAEFVTYGTAPKEQVDCTDAKVILPLGAVTADRLKLALAQLRPSGYTPIAYALQRTAADLPPGGKNAIILVTDGIESCGGDPCALSAKLGRDGILARSYVVGFGLGLDKAKPLSCIGKYFPAASRDDLKKALTAAVSESMKPAPGVVTVFPPGDHDHIVARGSTDEKLMLTAGRYDVFIRAGGKEFRWPGYKIARDTVVPVGEKPVTK